MEAGAAPKRDAASVKNDNGVGAQGEGQVDTPAAKKQRKQDNGADAASTAPASATLVSELVATLADPPGKLTLIKSEPPSLQLESESATNRRLSKNFLFKMWKARRRSCLRSFQPKC